MGSKETKYRVKTHIMGGGLSLREGDVVDEMQLGAYAEFLKREGGIEEVADAGYSQVNEDRVA